MRRFLRRLPDGEGQAILTPGGVSGLFLWLDATTNTGAPNSQITTWVDRSGNGRDAIQNTATNKPRVGTGTAFVPNSPTGKAGVAFDFSVPSFMGGTLPAFPTGIGTATGQTYYLWGNESQFAAANQVVWQDQFGGSPQLMLQGGGGGVGLRDALGTRFFGVVGLGAYFSAVWVFNPPNGGTGALQVYVNGTNVATGSWSFGFETTDSYFLGANQVANLGYAGLMYELLAYRGAHTSTQVRSLLAYGRGKWGIG